MVGELIIFEIAMVEDTSSILYDAVSVTRSICDKGSKYMLLCTESNRSWEILTPSQNEPSVKRIIRVRTYGRTPE
jgi:hypothetical protein